MSLDMSWPFPDSGAVWYPGLDPRRTTSLCCLAAATPLYGMWSDRPHAYRQAEKPRGFADSGRLATRRLL